MEWQRVEPILRAAYRAIDASTSGRVRGQAVCASLGVTEEDAAPAFRQLADAGYLAGTFNAADFPLVIEPTEKGLRRCSGWPAQDEASTFIESFLRAVEARADDEVTPEHERSRLRQLATAATVVGTKALSDIAAGVIAHKLPM